MRKKKPKKIVLHNLFIKGKAGYTGICLELNVASEGDTLEEAKKNVKEAVALYLESVHEHGDAEEAIPRFAPVEYWLKYFSSQERELRDELKAGFESMLDFQEAVA